MGTQFIKCYSLGRLWTPTEISKEGWFDAYDNATIIADSNRVLQGRDKNIIK